MNPTFPLKIRNSLKTLLAGIAILTAATAQTHAIVIVGNSGGDTGGFRSITTFGSIDSQYAAGFTMPAQSYTLTDVQLELLEYSGPNDAVVGLYLDNAGVPGSLHALLSDPAALADEPVQLYTFLPSGTVTLAAGTKYWLLVDHEPGGAYHWGTVSNTPIGVGTFNEYLRSLDNGSSYVSEGNGTTGFNFRFTINGEPTTPSVPDAGSTLLLLGLAFAGLMGFRRRSLGAASP